MASFEGSIGVPSGGFNLLVEYSISQSIDGNYSDVSATGYVKRNNSSYYPYNSQSSSSLTIDGSSAGYSGSYNLGSDGYKAIVSHSKRVYHNSDGTKGITISFSFNGLLSNWYPNGSISQYITLPTIPRASAVSCSSPYIGDTAIITIDRKSSNFTHTVSYHIGSLTATIADKTSSTVLSFNTESIKSQIYALMPNAKSIAGTIRCRTYSGNTKIGDTQVANFNLYAKENECKPDVSGVVIDTNEDTIDLTGDSSVLVKNASKPKVTVSATPKYSSSISSYSINLNDGQTSNSQEYTFNTINSNSITISTTDSRGYSSTDTIDLAGRVIDYVKLAFNELDLQRTESTSSEVILNANGAFYNGDFSQSITNALSCSFQYKESGSSAWIDGGTLTPTITNNTFRFTNVSLGNMFDYEKEYQFKIIANDLLMIVGNESKDVHVVTKGIAVVEIGDELVNINGEFTINDIPISTGDSLPIGTIVDYDGNTVPSGYQQVNTYSTSEVKTGDTWTNGKPMYRKVVNGYVQETSSGYPRIQTNLTNVDTICSIISTLKYSSRYYTEMIVRNNFYIDSQENYDIVFITPPMSGDVCFIIEYTKSTD